MNTLRQSAATLDIPLICCRSIGFAFVHDRLSRGCLCHPHGTWSIANNQNCYKKWEIYIADSSRVLQFICVTKKRNNVFTCISWWACTLSDQYFKSQKQNWLHHSANCIPVEHSLYTQFTRPFPLSEVSHACATIQCPGLNSLEGYEHNIILELIAVL